MSAPSDSAVQAIQARYARMCSAPGPWHGLTNQAYYCELDKGHAGDHASYSTRWANKAAQS